MKKIFLSAIVAAAAAFPTFAAVDTLNYSAVVRDNEGVAMANKEIGLRFQFVENETVVFEEEALATTSAAGVINYAIGTNASLDGIDWKANDIKLVVAIDVNGGTNYAKLSDSNVASVPTALYALKTADSEAVADMKNVVENLVNVAVEQQVTNEQTAAYIDEISNRLHEQDAINENILFMGADLDRVAGLAEEAVEMNEMQDGAIARLEKNFNTLAGKNSEVEGYIDEINNRLHEQEAINENVLFMGADLDRVAGLAEEAVEMNEMQDGAIARLQKDFNTLAGKNSEVEADLANLGENYEMSVGMLVTTVDENTAAIAELADVNELQDGTIARLQKDFNTLAGKNAEVEAAVAELADVNELQDGTMARLQKDFNTLAGKNAEVEAAVAELADVNELQDGTVARLQKDFNTLAGKNAEVEASLANLGENYENGFNRVETELEATKADLANLGENYENGFQRFETELEATKADLANLGENYENGFNRVETELEATKADLANLGENYENGFNRFETELEATKADLANLGENYEMSFPVLQAADEALQASIDEINNRLHEQDTVNENILFMGAELDRINGIAEGNAEMLDVLDGTVRRLQDNFNTLAGKNAAVEAAVAELADVNELQDGTIARLQKDFNTLAGKNAEVEASLANLMENLTNTFNEFSIKDQEMASVIENLVLSVQQIEARLSELENK